ncbi:MAG: hypothetical protein HYV75_03785, partial [Opitutae bacterium]|nr:hypothetical protein [Opitutae bacterium]
TVTKAAAEALVRAAHRRAAALVRRRGLKVIGPVHPADPENPWCCDLVMERRGEDTVGHDVPPDGGWMFAVHPGPGCETAEFGLCLYPATIRVGRRTLRTGCAGWGYAGFCKTQYASLHGEAHFLKCHRAIIDLLLIWKKLGAAVTIKDEGAYWPGRDEAKLLAEVGQMNQLVAAVGGAMKDAADEGGPSVQAPFFSTGSLNCWRRRASTGTRPASARQSRR